MHAFSGGSQPGSQPSMHRDRKMLAILLRPTHVHVCVCVCVCVFMAL